MSELWRNAWLCVSCHGQLGWWTVMHSHGRCPICGHKGDDACTIIETYERAYRLERIVPWWKFWGTRYRVIFAEQPNLTKGQ